MASDKIVVLDFGSQYTHLLARRVRELGVYSEILSSNAKTGELKRAKGIILSGGPASVYDRDAPEFNPKIFTIGIPVLGLCYGQQLIGQEMGGKVEPGKIKEYGSAKLLVSGGKLFEGLRKEFTVWMSHGDKVQKLPEGFQGAASTSDCEYAAIADDAKKIYGLQFHPEVTHTENGLKILSNFVFGVCKCTKEWSMENYLGDKIAEIRKEAGGKSVFLLLSGGVDSSIALVLLARALGREKVHALHVDTGFMRKGESASVKHELEKLGVKEVNVADASERFFAALEGIVEPEEKRKIIGQLFVDVAAEELKKLGVDGKKWLLGQGTIYPDTIETGGTKNSNRIKTHHNRAPVIMRLIEEGRVIEPLKQLYKDEVRELGRLLGLPKALVGRHPFPGPGLAIRILCSNGDEKADALAEKEIASLAQEQFGYGAKLLAVKAVGVQGDNRTYRNAVLLHGGPADYGRLERLSTAITNKFSSVNRVVFLILPKSCGAPRLERAFLSLERVQRLQEADAKVTEVMRRHGIYDDIWQFPVVLLPIDFGKGEAVVLRPVESREAMTAKFAKISMEILIEMAEEVLMIKGVGAVMLDITHKPPATIEWE